METKLPCTTQDPDLWFPVGTGSPAILQAEKAKAHCHLCSIEEACLQWALDQNEMDGVWGGTTEAERREMRLTRRPRSMSRLEVRKTMARALASK